MLVHITPKSGNAKTGPIPVTTTSADSCPNTCPFKGAGCYAESGPLAIHWRKVTQGARGGSWADLCAFVAKLPPGQLWRHNQAGDLPATRGKLNAALLGDLIEANKGRRGFTYTHHAPTAHNLAVVDWCNAEGFTVNLSANNLAHADKLADSGPVAVVLPADQTTNTITPRGRRVVICPAVNKGVTCETCGLCAHADRAVIVGFPAHGTGARKVSTIAKGVKK